MGTLTGKCERCWDPLPCRCEQPVSSVEADETRQLLLDIRSLLKKVLAMVSRP